MSIYKKNSDPLILPVTNIDRGVLLMYQNLQMRLRCR